MKKLLLAVSAGVIFVSSASAAEVKNVITDSVQLTVNGSGITNQRIGSTYSVSGSNIAVETLGSLTGGSATAAATLSAGSYDINTDGQAYTFSESLTVGDSVGTLTADTTNHQFGSPVTYGVNTIETGGTKGTLAGTLSPTGISTMTAGGQGTTALGQRTVTLSVFD